MTDAIRERKAQDAEGPDGFVLTDAELAAAFDQFRRQVKSKWGTSGTLAGTALVNEALAKLFAAAGSEDPLRFRDRKHFVASFFQAARHARVSHYLARERSHPIQMLLDNRWLYSIASYEQYPELENRLDADRISVVRELLARIRADPHVENREAIAAVVERVILGGISQTEAAKELGIHRNSVREHLKFFQRWAFVQMNLLTERTRNQVADAITRLQTDVTLANREQLARVATDALLHYQTDRAIARKHGITEAQVREHLELATAWLRRELV